MTQRPARSLDEMPTREEVLALSGQAFIEAIRDGRLAGPPISGVMNIHVHAVERGCVTFRGTPQFVHLNPMSGVHGGWYGTILDSALACAISTVLDPGVGQTTLEYKVNLTRAIPVGTEVDCIARVQHAGRTTAVAEAEIRGVADGRLYATGSTTCLIFQPRG